jgi:hypothetical protein
MNWTAFILVVIFGVVPMLCIVYNYQKAMRRIDERYDRLCKETDDYYKGKL